MGRPRLYNIPVYKLKMVRTNEVFKAPVRRTTRINMSDVAAPIFQYYLKDVDREHLAIMLLDHHMNLIGINTASIGNLTGASFAPREIFKPAILSNSPVIYLGHNHYSNKAELNSNDIRIVRELKKAGELMQIKIADSITVSKSGDYVSMFDEGVL
ncbi:MAG: JAB domain-containing protein [Desulfobacteraceae bacterium]|nr:JAB domain-containing protein [Desulfobacterales bacterium]MBL6967533.1 JAB domain-containing protein [Desulfobacteraceae bacterium]